MFIESTLDPRDWYDNEPGFGDSYEQDDIGNHDLPVPPLDEEGELNEDEESVFDQNEEDDTFTAHIDETETNLIENDAVTEEQLEVRCYSAIR